MGCCARVSLPQPCEFLKKGAVEPIVAANDHLGIDAALLEGGMGRSANLPLSFVPVFQGFWVKLALECLCGFLPLL